MRILSNCFFSQVCTYLYVYVCMYVCAVENPPLGQVSPPPQFLSLMRRCWEQDAEHRPAAAAVVAAIEAITEVHRHIHSLTYL